MNNLVFPYTRSVDGAGKDGRVPLSSVQLKAPIYDPDKLLCIGLNYKGNSPLPIESISHLYNRACNWEQNGFAKR